MIIGNTMQTILGAGGNIGSLLAKELKNYTDNIRLVSRNPIKVNSEDELMKADLTDTKMLDEAVYGSRIVYVTIAFDYKTKVWEDKWIPFIENVVEACYKHNSKLVFFDNVYIYDKNSLYCMTENTRINPSSSKGMVRKKLVEIIMNHVQAGKINALIARAPDFAGTSGSMLTDLIYNNFKKGKRALWIGKPECKHSFIYTKDAAKATAILGNDSNAFNRVWHLPVSSQTLSVQEWINLFAIEMGVPAKYSSIPAGMLGFLGLFVPIMRELKEMAYQFDRDYVFDSSNFCNTYDFVPHNPEQIVKEIISTMNN